MNKTIEIRATKYCPHCQKEHLFCEHCDYGECHPRLEKHHLIFGKILKEFSPIYFLRNSLKYIILVCAGNKNGCHAKLHKITKQLVRKQEKYWLEAKKVIGEMWLDKQIDADTAISLENEMRLAFAEDLLKQVRELAFQKEAINA